MQILFSPAKNQKYGSWPNIGAKPPMFINETCVLINYLKSLNAQQISEMMAISPKLSELNFARFKEFSESNWSQRNTGPAILSFQGDAYKSLDAQSLNIEQLEWANKHLYIISGLYGLLRPLDAMQYYRLEMKTKLNGFECKTLYKFWGNKLASALDQSKPIINLASGEYSKAIALTNIINIDFKEQNNKTVGIKAKKARGLMLRAIISQKITKPDDLKQVDIGYRYEETISTDYNWVFVAR